MGLFDSNSTSISVSSAPGLSATLNALANAFSIQSNQSPVLVNSPGTYSPGYSFSTLSAPTVSTTTNLSVQTANDSPGSSLTSSQSAGSSSLWQILIALGAVLAFMYFYRKK